MIEGLCLRVEGGVVATGWTGGAGALSAATVASQSESAWRSFWLSSINRKYKVSKNKFHYNFIKLQMQIIYNCRYNIHDIKYISDGTRLEAPTIAHGIESTSVRYSIHIHKIPATIWPRPRGP